VTIFDKNREVKFLRIMMHKDDWEILHKHAHGECKALATWARDTLLKIVKEQTKE